MKIITLCLAFMAWIQCAISPQTTVGQRYTRIMKRMIMESIHPSDPNNHDHPHFGIMNSDKITIYKVIDGHFAPYDAVKGFLRRTLSANHDRVLGHPPIIEGQHGEVEVRLGDQDFLYYAPLKRMPAYEDHGENSGRVKYFCTIGRATIIYLAGILENSELLHVPDNVERALFVNHLYKNLGDTSYQGELFVADPVRIQELFDSF